jgi:hypothetical protein
LTGLPTASDGAMTEVFSFGSVASRSGRS